MIASLRQSNGMEMRGFVYFVVVILFCFFHGQLAAGAASRNFFKKCKKRWGGPAYPKQTCKISVSDRQEVSNHREEKCSARDI